MLKLKPASVQIDQEDDAFFSITFWFYDDVVGYISLIRDNDENPDAMYIECTDQIYGFEINSLLFSFIDNELILELENGKTFNFDNSSKVCIHLNKEDKERVASITNTIVKGF